MTNQQKSAAMGAATSQKQATCVTAKPSIKPAFDSSKCALYSRGPIEMLRGESTAPASGESAKQAGGNTMRNKPHRKGDRLIEFVMDGVLTALGLFCGFTDVLRDMGGEVVERFKNLSEDGKNLPLVRHQNGKNRDARAALYIAP